MRLLLSCALALALIGTITPSQLLAADVDNVAAPAEPAGMKSLFNGTSLDGWDGDPRLWSVRDGVIHGETTEENVAKGNTFLIWQGGELSDFELRLSFRCTADNNSGILIDQFGSDFFAICFPDSPFAHHADSAA